MLVPEGTGTITLFAVATDDVCADAGSKLPSLAALTMHHRFTGGFRPRGALLRLEQLETRQLLSISPNDPLVNLPPVSEVDLASSYDASSGASALLSNATVLNPLTSIPKLSSLPGALVSLYLDFNGHKEPTYNIRGKQYTNIDTPVFDQDGDPNTFSSEELNLIRQIWEGVVEDFAPFKINVTTVLPSSFADGVAERVAIGGDGAWFNVVNGTSFGGVAGGGHNFINPAAPNTVFVFAGQSFYHDNPKAIANTVSHEAGHGFGLAHQSVWDGNTLVTEYSDNNGSTERAPIMGSSNKAERSLWWNGTAGPDPPPRPQDDLALLSSTENGFGYRDDDHGNTPSTATSLNVLGTSVSGSGIIATTDDVDYFRFTTGPGEITLSVSLSAFTNLDARLELRTANGTLIASSDPTNSLEATVTATVATGSYRLVVASHGNYGDVGQYSITGTRVIPSFAADDTATTLINTSVGINVLANDIPASGGAVFVPSTLKVTTLPFNGSVVINPLTGLVTYTPTLGFAGIDTFQYNVADNKGGISNIATVTVRVNRPPVAVDDSAKTLTNQPVAIDVLANDSDPQPNNGLAPSTVTIVTPPLHGTTAINTSTGAVTYTPTTNFFGNDSFSYTVKDIDGAVSNVAIVSIFVNAPPIAVDDTAVTNAGVSVNIPVLANDSDPTVGGFLIPSSVTVVSQPTNGTVTVDQITGVITYTPNLNFDGTDAFTYTVRDNDNAVSNVATVSVVINASPIAINDVVNTPINTPVTINVLANDFDPDGSLLPASLQIIQQPNSGTIVVDLAGNVTYTPNPGFLGGDTLTYRVADNRDVFSNIATVTFRVGPLSSLAGKVFLDLNNNGIQDGGETPIGGVTVWLDKTDGLYTYSDLYVTDPDGTYHFDELVTGIYTLREQHPGFFVDGIDTAGTPTPTSSSDDQFAGIVLAGGVSGTGFNFGEQGLKSQFVAAFLSRRTFFASSQGDAFQGINLAQGDAWIAVDGGINGQLNAIASSAASGSISLTLYDSNMTQVAKSVTGALLTYNANNTKSYFLKVSGTNPQVEVQTFVVSPITTPPPTPTPQRSWQNVINAVDVDADGTVALIDVLHVVNAIRLDGIGSLLTRNLQSPYFLDVTGDGALTLADVLSVVEYLRHESQTAASQATSSPLNDASSSAAPAVVTTAPSNTSSDIAFALAVDNVMSDGGANGTKRRTF